MLYKYENGILIGYQVTIDKKALEEVREKIICNCSIVEHCKGIFTSMFPISTNSNVIIK